MNVVTQVGEGRGRSGRAQDSVLCPVHEDRLADGFTESPGMVASVFQKAYWLSCGGDKTGDRETGGEGCPGPGAVDSGNQQGV